MGPETLYIIPKVQGVTKPGFQFQKKAEGFIPCSFQKHMLKHLVVKLLKCLFLFQFISFRKYLYKTQSININFV